MSLESAFKFSIQSSTAPVTTRSMTLTPASSDTNSPCRGGARSYKIGARYGGGAVIFRLGC